MYMCSSKIIFKKVIFLVPDVYPQTGNKVFNHHVYKAGVDEFGAAKMRELSNADQHFSFITASNIIVEILRRSCVAIVSDNQAMNILKQSQLLITETALLSGPLLSEIAKVPRVDVLPHFMTIFSHLYRTSMGISSVPRSTSTYTDQMSYSQRFGNGIMLLLEAIFSHLLVARPMTALQRELGIAPHKSYVDMMTKPLALIVDADFSVEFVHPLPPYVHFIGPILPKPAQPLSSELEHFVQSAGEHGVVVVAFGTYLFDGKKDYWNEMAKALGKIKQKVLWRTKLSFDNLAPNIKTMDWLPQNDLLGHSQTRAFISHVGHNSAYEAAYHGIPVIAAPMANDQSSIALRMSKRAKMAIVISIKTADAAAWQHAIEEAIYNHSYKSNATRVSNLLRSKSTTSAERFASIINNLERSGLDSSHLHGPELNQNYFVSNSFDVLVSFIAIILVVTSLSFIGLIKLCRFFKYLVTRKEKKA